MTSRERISTILSGGIPDRIGMADSYWGSTVQRWQKEGLPANVSPNDYFGTNDIAHLGGDLSLRFPGKLIEDTSEHQIIIDGNGVTRMNLKTGGGWTPHWLDYTIKDEATWQEHRQQLEYDESRIPGNIIETYQRLREAGKFIAYSGHTCFAATWAFIGQVNEFLWMAEKPDLITDLFATYTRLLLDIYDGMKRKGVQFDGAWAPDDMGYRNGPLFSPQMYRELVFPFHKQVCDHLKTDGLPTMLHSDGNIEPLLPMIIEAGYAAVHPLEVKAGLDIRELMPKYGDKIVFFGNIDVRALAGTKEQIEEEISGKILAGKKGKGYIFHSDHSVPHDVPFENYKFAIEMAQKYGSYR
ncbi:hypothetical protein H8E77_38310 [bacterium]|nr:hypothetical protein [bacterium]